jgi:hypothetical protein
MGFDILGSMIFQERGIPFLTNQDSMECLRDGLKTHLKPENPWAMAVKPFIFHRNHWKHGG